MDTKLIFTGPDHTENWIWNDWYRNGVNYRYYTWQLVFNLLQQRHDPSAVILETGCQRHENDIGDGVSTSLFCRYIEQFGGELDTVDISPRNIKEAEKWTAKYNIKKEFHCMDSLEFIKQYNKKPDLIYLDSFDYPPGQGTSKHDASQQHNLTELKLIYNQLKENTIVLLDDNQLPGGGKPRLAKEFLLENGWTCLLDWQQSAWIRSL